MKPFTPLDPSSMSAEARVAEVAATLARALVRLRAQPNPHDVRENQEDRKRPRVDVLAAESAG